MSTDQQYEIKYSNSSQYKAETRELTKSNEKYPTMTEIASFERGIEWIPESFQLAPLYLS